MPPSLSELKVLPSFCFAFKIPDDVAVTSIYREFGIHEKSVLHNFCLSKSSILFQLIYILTSASIWKTNKNLLTQNYANSVLIMDGLKLPKYFWPQVNSFKNLNCCFKLDFHVEIDGSRLMPCSFTSAKMFCADPIFSSQPKNLTAFKGQ